MHAWGDDCIGNHDDGGVIAILGELLMMLLD